MLRGLEKDAILQWGLRDESRVVEVLERRCECWKSGLKSAERHGPLETYKA